MSKILLDGLADLLASLFTGSAGRQRKHFGATPESPLPIFQEMIVRDQSSRKTAGVLPDREVIVEPDAQSVIPGEPVPPL